MSTKPYPPHWETVADLRVFRTTAQQWKLLRVSSDGPEMVAVFGRTKGERGAEP